MKRALAILLIALPTFAIDTTKKPNIFQRLNSDPKLPDELISDVDVIALPRTTTLWNPLTFRPFKVAKFKQGWKRSDGSEAGSGQVSVASEESRQRFSFTLEENDTAQWEVRCISLNAKESVKYTGKTSELEVDTGGTGDLTCEISTAQRVWNLEWGMGAETQGIGMAVRSSGKLTNGTSEFRIEPLYVVEDSKVIGDVPAGYSFRTPDGAVAAVHTMRAPGKFLVKKSVMGTDRALLAAASAALVLNERMARD